MTLRTSSSLCPDMVERMGRESGGAGLPGGSEFAAGMHDAAEADGSEHGGKRESGGSKTVARKSRFAGRRRRCAAGR